jgi:excisionase family DNA binding protein
VGEGNVSEFLPVAEAARWLGLSRRDFRRLRAKHPLADYRFGGDRAHPKFRRSDLDAWAERFRCEAQRPPIEAASHHRHSRGRKDWAAVVAGAALDNTPPGGTLASGVLRPERGG